MVKQTMRKSFKYRIYPNKAQTLALESVLETCRQLYNSALLERRYAYKMARVSVNYHHQAIELTGRKTIMKKTLTVFTLIVTLMLTAVPAFAATDYKVTVDGSYVNFPDQAPIERDQRILTPIRFPMEAMGVTATWEQDTQQAVLTKGDTTAIFTLGETTYTVNGVNKTMDTAPIALNDRTLFPIRFAAEAFGATVTWQAPDTAVIKTTPTQGAGNWEEYASIYYLNDGDQGMIFHNETTDQISINMISHPEMNIEGKFILNEQFFSGTRTYWINDYPSGTKFEFEVTYQEVWKGPITGPFPGSWVKP